MIGFSTSKFVARALVALIPVVAAASFAIDGPEKKIRLKGPFVPFALCFSELSAKQQIKLCQENGFAGIGLAGWSGPGPKEFADLREVQSGKFRVHSMLWWTKADMDLSGYQGKYLDETLTQLARMKAALWIVSDGPRNDPAMRAKMIDTLSEVARRCRDKKVPLVLYPHLGCVYETAEEGVEVCLELRKKGFTEVMTSIHLCHELKAGNGARIAEVVKKVSPYLALATVSGGDSDAKGRGGWETAIMPLDKGTYDVRAYLKALAACGYLGPIELHTYALPDPLKDNHLARSMKVWRALVAQ